MQMADSSDFRIGWYSASSMRDKLGLLRWWVRKRIIRRVQSAMILRWQLLKIRLFGVRKYNPNDYEKEPDENVEILKLLIDKGADINAQDNYGSTPLHYAVEDNRFINGIQYLIEHGANVDEKDSYSNTPLHIAARNCNSRKIQILVEAGASLHSLDRDHKTPYDVFVKEISRWHYSMRSRRRLDIAKITKLLRPNNESIQKEEQS